MRALTRLMGTCLALTLATPCVAETATKPKVTITNAWARAMPAGATVGAAYLAITTDATDRLIAIETPVAGRAELHTHEMADGIIKMRRVDSLEVKPGETSKMAPGGNHLMLFDMKQPLAAGSTVPLTLTFEKAGAVSATANVLPIGATGP